MVVGDERREEKKKKGVVDLLYGENEFGIVV